MNMATIQMPRPQAWNAYREYRKALGKKAGSRDRAVMAGYRALAKGKTVINLLEVMRVAGAFESGLPRLAIIRADKNICYCQRWQDGSMRFSSSEWRLVGGDISFPSETLPRRAESVKGRAVVPLVPPIHRPAETTLKNYYILWEAEWKTVPKDPALLKKLSGWLYAVVGVWDLTPLEQAVLYR